jgi:creatinine amidohydrolase/Fe(II)-dependent formamide hydrolase-like protein
VSEHVYEDLLTETAKSFKAHGFTTIVFLGDSGGNQTPQDKVAARLTEAWSRDGVRVINAADYYGRNGGERYLLEQGETLASIGSHAGIRDTSELLAVEPSAVRPGLAAKDADGATGDASRATAAYGEKLLTLKVMAAIREILIETSRPPETSRGLWARMFGPEVKTSTP